MGWSKWVEKFSEIRRTGYYFEELRKSRLPAYFFTVWDYIPQRPYCSRGFDFGVENRGILSTQLFFFMFCCQIYQRCILLKEVLLQSDSDVRLEAKRHNLSRAQTKITPSCLWYTTYTEGCILHFDVSSQYRKIWTNLINPIETVPKK